MGCVVVVVIVSFPKGRNESCQSLRHRLDFYTIDGDTTYLHLHNSGMELEKGKYIFQPTAHVVSAETAPNTFESTDLNRTYSMSTRRVFGGIGHRTQALRSLRLRGLSPEFGLLKENSRKRTKMPTEQEAKPAVVTPSLQQWRSHRPSEERLGKTLQMA
ncbi:hypothetical protein TNCV_5104871 [Trichonephila clavipes]|nr:hypothetical protein TNCV_5104871 [Trichonephila clavipes]